MEAIEIRSFNNDPVFQVQKLLDDNHIFAEVYAYRDDMQNVVCANIDGDWKHDHARADWLVSERLGGYLLRKDITEDTGCDWYPAIHYYYFPSDWKGGNA